MVNPTFVAYGSARIPAPTVVPATSAAAPSTEPGSCRSVLSLRLLNSRGWVGSWLSGPGLSAFAGGRTLAGPSACSVLAVAPSVPREAQRLPRSCDVGTRRLHVRPSCRAGGRPARCADLKADGMRWYVVTIERELMQGCEAELREAQRMSQQRFGYSSHNSPAF